MELNINNFQHYLSASSELSVLAPIGDNENANSTTFIKAELNTETGIVEKLAVMPNKFTCDGKEDLFICEKCHKIFKQGSQYNRLIGNHLNGKTILCASCKESFTQTSHIEKYKYIKTGKRKHVCDTCGASFILPHHLERHTQIHTGDRTHICETCGKTFTRKTGLKNHQSVHTGARPFICEAPGCGKRYTDKTTLRRHSLKHKKEKPFVCKECNKTFCTKWDCRKHYLSHFKPNESFKCSICEEMFVCEKLYKSHCNNHENNSKNSKYRCGFCLRVFKSQETLDAHVITHESNLVMDCKLCCAKFYNNRALKNHIKEKHRYKENSESDYIEENNANFDTTRLVTGELVQEINSMEDMTMISHNSNIDSTITETVQIEDYLQTNQDKFNVLSLENSVPLALLTLPHEHRYDMQDKYLNEENELHLNVEDELLERKESDGYISPFKSDKMVS